MNNKSVQEYYKGREKEVIDNFDSEEKELRQKLNGLNVKNEVVSKQLSRYRSTKNSFGETWRDNSLQKQKTNVLNQIDETQEALDKLNSERSNFLINKRGILAKDLKDKLAQLELYLQLSKRLKHELDKEERYADSLKEKEGMKRKYSKKKALIEAKEKEVIKFENITRNFVLNPGHIYSNSDDAQFAENIYETYKDNAEKFIGKKGLIGSFKPRFFLIVGAILVLLFSIFYVYLIFAYLIGGISGILLSNFIEQKNQKTNLYKVGAVIVFIIIWALFGFAISLIWIYSFYMGYKTDEDEFISIPYLSDLVRPL